MPGDPFQIDILPKTPLMRAAIAAARPVLEWVLALREYRKIYESVHVRTTEPFEARALRALDVLPQTSAADISRIPTSGPLIVAANHPHGLLDGLVLIDLVRRARPDVRVLTNRLLARIPELREFCLFVDPFNGPGAHKGFQFSPSGEIVYDLSRWVAPAIEYYGDMGAIAALPSVQRQQHFIVPAANLYLIDRLELNLGVGIGLTRASNGVFLKSIVGWTF